jgi:hypothetical protein
VQTRSVAWHIPRELMDGARGISRCSPYAQNHTLKHASAPANLRDAPFTVLLTGILAQETLLEAGCGLKNRAL